MRGFETEDARQAWDSAAETWEEFVESGADYYRWEVHGPGLLSACGDVKGQRILDLGCGQGWFSRQLADRGGDVVGVDLSAEMLAHARRHEEREPAGIEYVAADAAEVDRLWPANTFDLVTGCMSLQDMTDPAAAIVAVAKVLVPEGRLVFSVPHPFTDMRYREWERDSAGEKLSLKVDRYFESGAATLQWNISRLESTWQTPRWIFTLSEWCSLITTSGFVITDITEPRPTDDQVTRLPELEDCLRLPYFLVFQCTRA